MAKSRNFGGLIALALVVVAGAVAGWYYYDSKNDKQPDFTTTKISKGDITQAVTATGDLQPVVTVDVGAQVSGQVKDVLVDFNAKVKAGDILALIDPAPAQQRLRSAQADLESAKANNQLLKLTAERTRELYAKNLVSRNDLDTAEAQLAQSNAALMTKTAAVENAKLDVDHCTITSPIEGMVLNRNTDPGRTVNASMNAPILFTLVNDLTKLQINAAVAEADVGSISEGQDVTFTVDAYPNRTFRGTVRQVRNAATTTQSVVSYATIIDVGNEDLKLKPGMTANVSIIIAQKTNVLRVGNAALRTRIPAELLPKAPETTTAKATAPATMSDEERRNAVRSIMNEVGIQRGTPPTQDQKDRAAKLAKDKGVEDQVTRMLAFMSGGGRRGGQNGGDRGFTNTVTTRTVYKLIGANTDQKKIEPVQVKLGISDGITTEVISGLDDGDDVITGVTMPNAGAQAGTQNPFQSRGPGGFGGGFGRGR